MDDTRNREEERLVQMQLDIAALKIRVDDLELKNKEKGKKNASTKR